MRGHALTFEQLIRRCLSRKCLGRIRVRPLNAIVQEVECVRSTFWGPLYHVLQYVLYDSVDIEKEILVLDKSQLRCRR